MPAHRRQSRNPTASPIIKGLQNVRINARTLRRPASSRRPDRRPRIPSLSTISINNARRRPVGPMHRVFSQGDPSDRTATQRGTPRQGAGLLRPTRHPCQPANAPDRVLLPRPIRAGRTDSPTARTPYIRPLGALVQTIRATKPSYPCTPTRRRRTRPFLRIAAADAARAVAANLLVFIWFDATARIRPA